MIPEELHLRNFLSHRETDLDLRGVHLASLVGENGAGKSALLDAITWAVWGRSRAPYGRDEDLVYHGEDNLEVEFVFRMPYQGGDERRCRILRRRERQGRRSAGSVLDFQVEGDEGWRNLTADSIRETQNRIIAQLGLDYDTFVNSAYLRQGHADEFTVQTSGDRKRVLGAILGLDRWNEYQDRVKKRLSSAQGRIQEMDRRLSETEQELARRSEYETLLAEAEAQVQAAAASLAEIQTQVDEINRVQEQALALRRQIADLDERRQQEKARLAQLEQQEETHQGQQAYYASMVEQAAAIETNYQALHAAVAEERAWGEKLGQAARLQSEKSAREQAIAAEREALNKQLRAAEQKIERIERVIAANRAAMERALSDLRGQIALLHERTVDPALQAKLDAARAELVQLDAIAEEQALIRETLQTGEVERSRLIERNRQLRELMNEAKSRIETLAEAEAACPLCRQPLTPEHQERLLNEIQAEGKTMGDEHRANDARIQTLKDEKAALQSRLQEQERLLRTRPQQEQTVARLQQQIEQSDDARKRIAIVQAQAAEVESQLAAEAYADAERPALEQAQAAAHALQTRIEQEDYAADARAELDHIHAELAELGYDAGAHQEVKKRVQALAHAEDDYRELEKARVSIEKEAETLKRLALEIEAQHGRITALEAERATQEAALDALRPTLAEAPRLTHLLNEARQREAVARQRIGAARQNLAALETLERRQQEMRAQREELGARVGLLTELRDAFGVNGIPAMIIEHTLPELEREANHILQSLTAGRMHVRFDTQRETKTGNLRETLDIIISDEKGTRPYENFSIDGSEPVCIRRNGKILNLPIQNLWSDNRVTVQMDSGHEIQAIDFEALCYRDGKAVWLPAANILRHPAPETLLRVKLSPGNYSIAVTSSHSVYVMTPEGLSVKRGDELRPGDWMLTPRRIPEHEIVPQIDLKEWIPDELIEHRVEVNKPLHWDEHIIWSRRDQTLNRYIPNNVELAEFMGIAVAEGSGKDIFTLAVGNNRPMAERVVHLANKLFGVLRTGLGEVSADAMARYMAHAPGISSTTPQERFQPELGGRLLTQIIKGMIGDGAYSKRIPPYIFNAPDEVKLMFLKALIAGDGYWRVRPEKSQAEIGITTISPQLIADTVFLCRQLQIWARVEKHGDAGFRRNMNHQTSYRVAITGQNNVQRLFDDVKIANIAHPGKFEGIPLALLNIERNTGQRRLKRVQSDANFKCGTLVVPKRSQAQYEQMLHWLEDWAVLEVTGIEPVSPTTPYVYDLVVPDNHSFTAGTGAILVHNSGGEQFRVNFAIRVALSRMLAQRAGVRLRSLFVDEGFGSLDTEGRQRLVEAVKAVQHEFDLVLVITHIDELREAFPTQIQVTKGEGGSIVEVV